MIRFLTMTTILGLGLAVSACGDAADAPAGIDTYEQALDRQSDLMRRITGVLEGVTDEDSAKKAAPRLEELSARLQRLAMRMNELPPPSFEESQRLTRERAEGRTQSRRESARQMQKIEQYPALKEAWQRGMQSAGS